MRQASAARLQLRGRAGDRGIDGGLPARRARRAGHPDGDLQPARGPLPPEQSASGEARADRATDTTSRRCTATASSASSAASSRWRGGCSRASAAGFGAPLLLPAHALRRRRRSARVPAPRRCAAPLRAARARRGRLQRSAARLVPLRRHRRPAAPPSTSTTSTTTTSRSSATRSGASCRPGAPSSSTAPRRSGPGHAGGQRAMNAGEQALRCRRGRGALPPGGARPASWSRAPTACAG